MSKSRLGEGVGAYVLSVKGEKARYSLDSLPGKKESKIKKRRVEKPKTVTERRKQKCFG